MAVLNLFGGFSIEVEEGFNPFNATPKQLSQLALDLIEKYPDNFAPSVWHLWKKNLHSYAGFVDLLLGATPSPTGWNMTSYYALQNPVQEVLGMSDEQWDLFVDPKNSFARLQALHKLLFIDGVYGTEGWDSEGYNLAGYNSKGYDRDGYNADGFDSSGYDRDGFDLSGYDRSGLHLSDYYFPELSSSYFLNHSINY